MHMHQNLYVQGTYTLMTPIPTQRCHRKITTGTQQVSGFAMTAVRRS